MSVRRPVRTASYGKGFRRAGHDAERVNERNPTELARAREDMQIECLTCGGTFVWTAGEQVFFATAELTRPKRCVACAKKRKEQHRLARQPVHQVSGGLPSLGRRR
jgi:hypothetical protein